MNCQEAVQYPACANSRQQEVSWVNLFGLSDLVQLSCHPARIVQPRSLQGLVAIANYITNSQMIARISLKLREPKLSFSLQMIAGTCECSGLSLPVQPIANANSFFRQKEASYAPDTPRPAQGPSPQTRHPQYPSAPGQMPAARKLLGRRPKGLPMFSL